MINAIEQRGATVVRLTHATGLSATGDETLDASLPWPERYSIPVSTLEAIEPTTKLRVVDALITGIHSPQESHCRLLGALLPPEKLAEVMTLALAAGLEPHAFGDVAFVQACPLPDPLPRGPRGEREDKEDGQTL